MVDAIMTLVFFMDIRGSASKFNQIALKNQKAHLLPLLSLIVAGCASVSVGNIHEKGTPPKKLPAKIYVQEFEAPEETFRVDRTGHDLTLFIQEERQALAKDLAQQLTKYVAPAEILPSGRPLPHGNYWVVRGDYIRVNQGSRILRAAIGFGAGGTKMETRVQVADIGGYWPDTFLSMLTTGGSGMVPGAAGAFSPALPLFLAGAAANAGGASLSGLSVDRSRTAREITAAISEYCFQHGLINERRTRRPKKLGALPPVQRPDFIAPKTAP
jgi:hypothetical protein